MKHFLPLVATCLGPPAMAIVVLPVCADDAGTHFGLLKSEFIFEVVPFRKCHASTIEDHGWQVYFEFTADLGQTWTTTGPSNDGKKIAAIQPGILFHQHGCLQAVGRTRQGRIFSITSDDSGKTWSEMTLLGVPNPDSGIDAATLRGRRHKLNL